MKFQLFLLISCLVVLSQSGRWPQSESDWSYEPVPKPKNPCNCLPNAVNVEFTPIVTIDVTFDTKVNCDSSSKFKAILDTSTQSTNVTCNGVVVDSSDALYTVVIGGGYGSKNTETIKLTNYTAIDTYNNGNVEFQECGTITGGKCSGDTFIGTGILVTNDQKGCCKGGITGETALERQINIIGKCASSCTLDHSIWTFAEPVSNAGLVDRSIAVETHE